MEGKIINIRLLPLQTMFNPLMILFKPFKAFTLIELFIGLDWIGLTLKKAVYTYLRDKLDQQNLTIMLSLRKPEDMLHILLLTPIPMNMFFPIPRNDAKVRNSTYKKLNMFSDARGTPDGYTTLMGAAGFLDCSILFSGILMPEICVQVTISRQKLAKYDLHKIRVPLPVIDFATEDKFVVTSCNILGGTIREILSLFNEISFNIKLDLNTSANYSNIVMKPCADVYNNYLPNKHTPWQTQLCLPSLIQNI
uniref:Uncharacterized protein n=1 Tax=Glossina austeni TaxID=7395 RepID=A0A1A9VTT2_GLOAU